MQTLELQPDACHVDCVIVYAILPQVKSLITTLTAHLKEGVCVDALDESLPDMARLHKAYAMLNEMINHLLPTAPKREVIEARKYLPDQYSNAITHMVQPEKKKKNKETKHECGANSR